MNLFHHIAQLTPATNPVSVLVSIVCRLVLFALVLRTMSVLRAQICEMKPGKHPQRQDHVLVYKMQYQKQMEHVYVLLT